MSSIKSPAIINVNTIIICIPGVFPNIGEERIRRAFTDLDIGEVTRVDIVKPKIENPETAAAATPKNKKPLNRVFVHLIPNNTQQAVTLKEKLLQGKQIKIVYDQPWFWNISLYKKKEKAPEEPKQFKHKKATLIIEEDEPTTPAAVVVTPQKAEPTKPAAATVTPQKVDPEIVCDYCLHKGHTSQFCPVDYPDFITNKPIDYGLNGQAAPTRRKRNQENKNNNNK